MRARHYLAHGSARRAQSGKSKGSVGEILLGPRARSVRPGPRVRSVAEGELVLLRIEQ